MVRFGVWVAKMQVRFLLPRFLEKSSWHCWKLWYSAPNTKLQIIMDIIFIISLSLSFLLVVGGALVDGPDGVGTGLFISFLIVFCSVFVWGFIGNDTNGDFEILSSEQGILLEVPSGTVAFFPESKECHLFDKVGDCLELKSGSSAFRVKKYYQQVGQDLEVVTFEVVAAEK